jgi:tetratricopeptide (TPR) repeat protein
VEVYSPTGLPDYVQLNFRLEEDKSMRPQTPMVNETVYAQEVPQDAERSYKKGVEKLKANNKDGFKDLENALKIFPTYFYALRDMGIYTVSDGKYEEGYPYLLKAVDVHRRCGECFYHLANAFLNMKQNDAAVKASEAAVALLPNNSYAYLMYGVVLRLNEQYKPAESALQKANTLFDKPNPSVYWELSLVHNRLGENGKAADDLTAYLDAKPDLKKDEKRSVEDMIKKLRSGNAD